MSSDAQRAYERVSAFTERVIREELGGKSYAADAGALATLLDYISALEAALTNLMQESADHIIAGYPLNADALAALREAERVLTTK